MFVEQFPILPAASTQQSQVASLVEQILAEKKADSNADTSALESEIDAFVYKLYGITDEKEIAIIEGRDGKNGGTKMPAQSDAHHGGAVGVRALPDGGRAGSRPSRKPPRNDDDDEVLE